MSVSFYNRKVCKFQLNNILHDFALRFFIQVDDFIVPWKSIISSPPVWGIIAANFALDWAFYILLISMPTFLMDVMKTSITKVTM